MIDLERSDRNETAENGRGPNGRFAPANRFGAIKGRQGRCAEIRDALAGRANARLPDILKLFDRLIDDALAGDNEAAKIVLDRAAGRVRDADTQSETGFDLRNVRELVIRACEVGVRLDSVGPADARRLIEALPGAAPRVSAAIDDRG